MPPHMVPDPAAVVASAAAVAAVSGDAESPGRLTKRQVSEIAKAQRSAKDAEKTLETKRLQSMKKEQRRATQEQKEMRAIEREASKAAERSAREATREERRHKKMLLRRQREQFSQEQKNLALLRCAELVQSNRVPIEITRGAMAAQAAANAAVAAVGGPTIPMVDPMDQKKRSAIVVSTASDLHQIVTHAKNLWTKYNAIAKEHNQKVNWIVVAKELGIHVKVREKYARMHARAEQRGFDWVKFGHYRIKDYPQIFLEPTQAEQKAKMPPPPPDESRTVLIDGTKEAAGMLIPASTIALPPEAPAGLTMITTTFSEPSMVPQSVPHLDHMLHHQPPSGLENPAHTHAHPEAALDDSAATAAAATAAAATAAQMAAAQVSFCCKQGYSVPFTLSSV